MKLKTTTSLVTGVLLVAAAGALSAQDYSIDHYVIAGGGILESTSDDGHWQLSGTIGQWEATEARKSTGEDWSLTGGFWAMTLEERLGTIFSDRFEQDGN